MPISAVEICNRALNAIGAEAITALSDDTARAVLCNRLYTDLRDELLQDHPWNFAIRRSELAADATAPDFEWLYKYQLPTGCLRVLSVYTALDVDQWEVEGGYIFTDLTAPLEIRYVSNDVTENNFSPAFATALSLRLAVELALPLTESMSRADALTKRFMVAIKEARGRDAREHGPQTLTIETLIEARR